MHPAGACSGGPEKLDSSPDRVQVLILVNTRAMLVKRGIPFNEEFHGVVGP
jgi:hypothetical protein